MLRVALVVVGAVLLSASVAGWRPAPPASAATANVTVADDPSAGGVFTPKDITINAGDTVHWAWDAADQNPHSVTADDGSFDEPAGDAKTAGTFDHIFNAAGTFAYYCRIHGAAGGVGMSGTVTVLAASTSTPVPPTSTAAATQTPAATATSGATQTVVATVSAPQPASTVAVVSTAPGGGSAGAQQLPRTGAGARDHDAGPWWPAAALGAAGLSAFGIGAGWRRAPRRR